jgi:hypothetical protein
MQGVMLTSGRFVEAWAAERARHDLNALLARALRTARRYRGGALETVPLEAIEIGDVLLVAPGEVLPVDGAVTAGVAVLDESALGRMSSLGCQGRRTRKYTAAAPAISRSAPTRLACTLDLRLDRSWRSHANLGVPAT